MTGGGLRLLAADAEGLGIIAAAVQDALVRQRDMRFDSRSRSFGAEISRFQWEKAGKASPWFRSRAVLAFSGVLGVRTQAMPSDNDAVASLLDVRFTPDAEPPGGEVTLLFAQGGKLRLKVECLDATLMDNGAVWPTRRKPDHGTSPP